MKPETDHPIDNLLVKSLLDEASVAEQMEINLWLCESDQNQQYFEHFETIWTESRQLLVTQNLDENAAWERFKLRVNHNAAEPEVIEMYPAKTYNWLRIAAILVLGAAIGWIAFLNFRSQMDGKVKHVSSAMQTLTDTLPDGSVIVMNRKSSISYPEKFTGNTRNVNLTGEAFFNVKPDKLKPFIISVNGIIVKVLGTSFNIKTIGNKTEVIVETGLVEVARDANKIRLKREEKTTVSDQDEHFIKQHSKDQLYQYYRTNRLVCDGTPLWRLVEILNEAFDANIVIQNEQIRNYPINTTFEQQNVDSIISIISETFSIQAQREGRQIILK